MTPNQNRPPDLPRNPSAGGALGLNRSNSTANIFLGGARKSWMATGNNHQRRASKSSNNHPSRRSPATSTPASLSSAAASGPPLPPSRPAPPVTATSSTSSPATTRPSGMRSFSSHPQQSHPASLGAHNSLSASSTAPVASSAAATVHHAPPAGPQMQPTTSTTPPLTHSPASHPLPPPVRAEQYPRPVDSRQQQQHKQQLQQSQLQAQSASSLPSPDPTIPPRSHKSPSIAIGRNEPTTTSPSAAAFPSPPIQQAPPVHRPPQDAPSPGRPSVSPNNQPGGGNLTPLPGQKDALTARFNPPAPTPAVTPRQPSQQQQNAASPAYTRMCPTDINHGFFARAKAVLGAIMRDPHQSRVNKVFEAVESPRIQLLHLACSEQDLMFLVLHQVYCLSSFNEQDFKNLPGITPKHVRGLDTVRHLLVDNARVSDGFLQWSVQFPYPLPEMLRVPAYLNALNQVRHLLTIFVDRWVAFERHVRSRGHPPLVDDLVRELDIKSPVLLFNIFLCLCRRSPGARHEGKLQEVFIRDVENFKRRNVEQIPEHERQRENEQIISTYRSITAAMTDPAPGQPEPSGLVATHLSHAVPTPRPPAPSQAVSSSIRSPATGPDIQNHLPAHVQSTPQFNIADSMAPASVRSPPVAASRGPSCQPSSSQPPLQQRGVGAQVPPPHTPAIPFSPLIPIPPAQYVARRELPQGYSIQQLSHLHPRAVPQQPYPAPVPAHAILPSNPRYAPLPQRQPPSVRPFLPPPNEPPVMNTRPDPRRLAIHQAYLRDPVNRPVSLNPAGGKETELFPNLTSFAVKPTAFGPSTCIFKWEFSLSQADLNRFPVLQSQGKGQRKLRTLMEGNQTYRLRCIKVPPSATEVKEHSWSSAETVWPCAIYMFVNGEEFHARRKIHNGRDLPLDITTALREGANQIAIHFIRNSAEQSGLVNYAMAVEVLTFHSFSEAKALAKLLPAAESRRQICGRLTRTSSDDDDELRIVSDDLKVTLVDPFTARLFMIPVRGRHCEHPECFDHETFLQTRALKNGDCSAVEADWRCPICRQDARPQSLVVDGFLLEIRAALERTNRCEGARSLQIRADGTWDVKTDEDSSSQQGVSVPSRTAPKRKSTALDDGIQPLFPRPKINRSASLPTGVVSRSPGVIILD
ncbi:MIZ zinc finger domain protein [Aspergillus lucknowensis]|uniref:SP-RING-type domain-containing protein n=1 Tax=Aspergillus lucknowensis TaxID=176173 RepID=A0ABR4LTY0_9EURO